MLSTRAKPAVVAAREAADIIGGRSGLRELADERLAGLARSGSERAFAVLYLRYHRELYRYCRSALVNEADAHDAMQSAFASGLALIQAGKGSLPVRPWLYKLAHEQVTVLSRSREYLPVSPHTPARLQPSGEAGGRERARLARLAEDLLDLSERQRATLVLHELCGLSHLEIARTLSISPSMASRSLFEARKSLQECNRGRDMVCEETCRALSDGDGGNSLERRARAHIRGCVWCKAFAAQIRTRRSDLRALAPPIAPAVTLALLKPVFLSGSGTGTAGSSAAGLATTGNGAVAVVSGKALSAIALAAIATGGVGGLKIIQSDAPATRAGAAQGPADRLPPIRRGATATRRSVVRTEPHVLTRRSDHDAGLARPRVSVTLPAPVGTSAPAARDEHLDASTTQSDVSSAWSSSKQPGDVLTGSGAKENPREAAANGGEPEATAPGGGQQPPQSGSSSGEEQSPPGDDGPPKGKDQGAEQDGAEEGERPHGASKDEGQQAADRGPQEEKPKE